MESHKIDPDGIKKLVLKYGPNEFGLFHFQIYFKNGDSTKFGKDYGTPFEI